MLFPVYVATTKFNGKAYSQYVAGFWSDREKTKANVSGKYPKSPWKILLTALAGLAVLAGIIFLLIHASQGVTWSDVLSGWEFDW